MELLSDSCDHQEIFKVLVYLDIYGQVIISLMLVDKCIYIALSVSSHNACKQIMVYIVW